MLIVLISSLLVSLVSSSILVPGAVWVDTTGTPIQAHGSGFLKHNNLYYWFGEDKTENNQKFLNVKAYSSSDLVSWTFVSNALTVESSASSEIGADAVVERPKVLFNSKTQTFVMWFHLDNSAYGLAKLGVAFSKSIEGPYEFHKSISPFNEDSRDMTVWMDEDGQAYLFYATQVNLNTVIARLTPDFLDIQEKVHTFWDVRWEAYAMFKLNGLYYLITSGTSGWSPNQNHYTYSSSLVNGSWVEAKPIAPDSPNTFNSQSNNVIEVGSQFIFTGDRWISSALGSSTYVWLPIEIFPDNSIKISWAGEWWIDTESGQWGESNSLTFEAEAQTHVSLEGDAHVIDCSGCTNGKAVGYVGMGGKITFFNLTASQTSNYSIIVGYANGDGESRQAFVDVNGVYKHLINFPSTGGGQTKKELVFQAELQQRENNSISFYNDEAYAPDFDSIRVQCYYFNC